MNIFVARLSSSTTGDDLNQLFGQYGQVKSAKVIFDRETGESRCFGFVEMDDEAEGNMAIENIDGAKLNGRAIVAKKAHAREERATAG